MPRAEARHRHQKQHRPIPSQQQQGRFQASTQYWSGRPDPDGNIHQFVSCHGSTNDGHYCNPKLDDFLNTARTTPDVPTRQALYKQASTLMEDELPTLNLFFEPRLIAMSRKVTGFQPNPDGLIRLNGVAFAK